MTTAVESQNLVNLRADLAMRVEDLRIARKHRAEAGARVMSEVTRASYAGALRWEQTCAEREQVARAAVIAVAAREV